MAYPYKPAAGNVVVTTSIADISTAGQIYVAPGFNGRIRKAFSALNGAITGADSVLTLKINGTAVTGGTMTVANSGSAAGDVDSCTPSGANVFDADDAVEIETDGASTGTVATTITLELEPI
jgi:hypothetical protein